MDEIEARKMVAGIAHWYHKFEIWPGVVTPGSYEPQFCSTGCSSRSI
jgi:tRNA (mo5U34)-methyltransferase